jgi:ZIP family zinc transporter
VIWLENLPVVLRALVATLFTYAMTAAGSATVFFCGNIDRKVLDGMLGFAAGVMIAASFFSLLAPAIEMADILYKAGKGLPSWAAAAIGFACGGVFLRLSDRLVPHLHAGTSQAEGVKTNWSRSILLVLAITIHNIPEGLAVGVGFGAAALLPGAGITAAVSLALGIGLQNFPEGAAVSIPLRREGMSRLKSFWIGQASGIVEPIAGVAGAALVLSISAALPYLLGFAAGAMIFVVAEELIPEAYRGGNDHISTAGIMAGFTLMMIMDIGLG